MARLINKKPAVEDVRKLTGPEKAAVVLLSLGEDHTRLWSNLDEDEIKEIFLQVAIYCGIPASLDAFKTARDVFKERGV